MSERKGGATNLLMLKLLHANMGSGTSSQADRSLLTTSSGNPPLETFYDAVLFDLDGVFADTERLHWTCWQRLFAGHGVDLTWKDYTQALRGYSGEELLARLSLLYPQCVGCDQIITIYAQKKLLYRDLVASLSIVPEAVVALVNRLPVPCAVVTSSERVDVERALLSVGLLTRFAAIVCCEDVDEPKPAPNGYKKALVVLGAQRALAVEDSDAGAQSATAAGLEVLQVPSPHAMPAMVAEKLCRLSQIYRQPREV
jgi:beta-phosphoglucomutase